MPGCCAAFSKNEDPGNNRKLRRRQGSWTQGRQQESRHTKEGHHCTTKEDTRQQDGQQAQEATGTLADQHAPGQEKITIRTYTNN